MGRLLGYDGPMKIDLENPEERKALVELIRMVVAEMVPPPEKLLISKSEAAKRLGVSSDRVAALVACGKLPSVAIGKREKIRPKDLEALIEKGDLNPPRPGRPRAAWKAPASTKMPIPPLSRATRRKAL